VSLLNRLRERTRDAPHTGNQKIGAVRDAPLALCRSREALLPALEGEEVFYRIGTLGREEYSEFSLLENVELHDQEHGWQIEQICAANAGVSPV
jgi:hypothetical protein